MRLNVKVAFQGEGQILRIAFKIISQRYHRSVIFQPLCTFKCSADVLWEFAYITRVFGDEPPAGSVVYLYS